MIELTPEQRQAVGQGEPVRVIDPTTQDAYIILRAELFEQFAPPPACPARETSPEIAPGIRRSQEALRRDLPQLLGDGGLVHQWAAYHGDERVGIAPDAVTLLRECHRRGFKDDEYYIGWIDPTELIAEEDIGPRRPELEEVNPPA